MFDNINLKINNFTTDEFWKFIDTAQIERPNESEKIKFDWHNLRIEYYPNAKTLNIKNSIHKFYNSIFNELIRAPVNYNNFTYSDLCFLTDYFSIAVFDRDPKDFTIFSKFEYGVNLDTGPINSIDVINRYLSYSSTTINEFYAVPPYKGKSIGKTCYFSDFRIKMYDKVKESKSSSYLLKFKYSILRYELVITEIRHLKKLLNQGCITLHDLNIQENWLKLFNHLVKLYKSIKKIPMIETEINNIDIYSIYAYCNKLLAEDIKRNKNKHTYDKLRANFKKIYDQYDSSAHNLHNVILCQLENKIYDLLN